MTFLGSKSLLKASFDDINTVVPSNNTHSADKRKTFYNHKNIGNNTSDATTICASASMSSLTELDTNENDVLDVKPTTTGEERMFDEFVEREGYKAVFQALSLDEKRELADANMPLRYFRAEKGNVHNAIKKIKATLAWQKEFEVDKIRTCFDDEDKNDEIKGDSEMRKTISFENQTGKIYVRGYDRNGRAVLYLRPGLENSKNELNNMRHLVYHLERAIACTAKNGKEKFVIVIDYIGFRLRNAPPMSVTKHTLSILQNHYPERMHRAYLCNPPLVFRTFWNIMRPFIDPVTKEKVVFCVGHGAEKKLEKHFDLTTMEKCAFGTRELRKFCSEEYLKNPLNTTFDEKPCH